jgi:hypothetical protein
MSAPPAAPALLELLAEGPLESFADIGGGAPDLALALAARSDVEVQLVDLDKAGRFNGAASDWVGPYRAGLEAAGVDPARIRHVGNEAALKPADLIANRKAFGDRWKVRHLGPLLPRLCHADSRMVMDIRKGSGSFPFLRDHGTTEILWRSADEEETLVLFRPAAPESPMDDGWLARARDLAGRDGFVRAGNGHSMLFIPRGETLVVTFDNLDIVLEKRADRLPWGHAFIERQGFSMLGVMADGWSWYRDPWVWDEFDRLRDQGFFRRFGRVVFYGASMGGYAACAFSAACPGADVVAISPQSTLDPATVPWETRYRTARGRDWTGPYADASVTSRTAGRVILLYDPYEPLDRGHAERFTAPNVVALRTPLLGHRLGSSLLQMGLLSDITLSALEGQLDPVAFYRRLRARHTFPRYQRELFQRAVDRGRPGLALKVGRWVLRRGDNRFIRLRMAGLEGQIHAG